MLLSVVIPVFNSEMFIKKTVNTVFTELENHTEKLELVLVDDSSTDNVWNVLCDLAAHDERIKIIRLARNCGQHIALFVGLSAANGDCVVTIDDDLQNPPEEIPKLLNYINSGHDLVVGSFPIKSHSLFRNIGSKIIHWSVSRIFISRSDFRHTNFHAISRSVLDRVLSYKGDFPYINGLCIQNSTNPINIEVRHDQRVSGKSNYSLMKLIALAFKIIYSYSDIPIKAMLFLGFSTSVISLMVGIYALINSLLQEHAIPGWTSLIVVVSFSNALIFIILSLLVSFLSNIRTVVTNKRSYLISEQYGKTYDNV